MLHSAGASGKAHAAQPRLGESGLNQKPHNSPQDVCSTWTKLCYCFVWVPDKGDKWQVASAGIGSKRIVSMTRGNVWGWREHIALCSLDAFGVPLDCATATWLTAGSTVILMPVRASVLCLHEALHTCTGTSTRTHTHIERNIFAWLRACADRWTLSLLLLSHA